jgi:molybdopterin synthase catalytic subunit
MNIHIQLVHAAIEKMESALLRGSGQCGALVEFNGIVRGEENGQTIAALEYDAYEPMAEKTIREILHSLGLQHPCLAVVVIHRIGIVPVGESAIYVAAVGRHRGEAFALVSQFMDRLKQDVPIWKRRALPSDADSSPNQKLPLCPR